MAFTPRVTSTRLTDIQLYGEPSAAGAGTVTQLDQAAGITLTPNPITGTGTVGVATGGVTDAMLASSYVYANGTRPLTGHWAAGNYRVDAQNSTKWFNVRAYGAVGDGATLDTTAFTDCIAAALVLGGVVYVPAGSYRVDALTVDLSGAPSIRFVGDGFNSVIVTNAGAGDAIKFTSSDAFGSHVVSFDCVSFGTFGVSQTAGSHIRMACDNSQVLYVTNCRFANYFVAVKMNSCYGSVIADNFFMGTGATTGAACVWVDNTADATQGDNIIVGNAFGATCQYGVRQSSGAGLRVLSNKMIGMETGILVDTSVTGASGIDIKGNSIEDFTAYGISFAIPGGTMQNCLIQGNQIGVTTAGTTAVGIATSGTGVVLESLIQGNFLAAEIAGIVLDGAAANSIRNLQITGNYIGDANVTTTTGLLVSSNERNISVAGNVYHANVTTPETIPDITRAGTSLFYVNKPGTPSSPSILLDSYGTTGPTNITARRSRGTVTGPSAVQSADSLLSLHAYGYGATGFSTSRGAVVIGAAENWTDANQGTAVTVSTTSTGSTTLTERLRVDGSGNFLVGTATGTGSRVLVNGTVELKSGSGGGYKFADGSVQTTAVGTGGACPSARLVSTTAPLSGGGDLTADRTLSIAVTTTNDGGAVAKQAATPGTAQTGNINVDGTVIAGTALQVGAAPSGTPNASVRNDTNGTVEFSVENQSNGASALSRVDLQSDVGTADFEIYGQGYGGTGARQALAAGVIVDANNTAGLSIAAQANAPIRFYTGGISSGEVRARITGTGVISLYNLAVHANNAAAIGAGLAAGDLYRTGGDPDTVCVVH